MLAGDSTRCANHPDRPAMGVCVRCGKLVCVECATQVDGINHCVSCLTVAAAARASVAPAQPSRPGGSSLVLLTILLALALWGVLEATLPG